MHDETIDSSDSSDHGDTRTPVGRLGRVLSVLLPVALIGVLVVALGAGPADAPESLAFDDETAADSGAVDDELGDLSTTRNAPPLAQADSASTAAGQTSVVIPVLGNDSDADGDDLYVARAEVTSGDGVVLVISAGRELAFTPEPGTLGPWSITYVVSDGADGFDQAMVIVRNGDEPPRAVDDVATATTGRETRIDVRANDLDDAGAEALTLVAVRILEPKQNDAAASIAVDGSIAFTAPATPGLMTLEYDIEDQMRQGSTGVVTIDVQPAQPVAVDDRASTPEDIAIVVDVLANDGPDDVALDQSTLRILSSSSGSASLVGGGIRYEPPPDAVGEAQITYEICAVSTACDTASVRIEVTPVQDLSPFAAEGQLKIPSDAGPQVIPWLVVSSGQSAVTPDMSFSISTDRPELFAEVPAISPTGILTFSPRSDLAGTANTTITVRDAANGERSYRLALIIE